MSAPLSAAEWIYVADSAGMKPLAVEQPDGRWCVYAEEVIGCDIALPEDIRPIVDELVRLRRYA